MVLACEEEFSVRTPSLAVRLHHLGSRPRVMPSKKDQTGPEREEEVQVRCIYIPTGLQRQVTCKHHGNYGPWPTNVYPEYSVLRKNYVKFGTMTWMRWRETKEQRRFERTRDNMSKQTGYDYNQCNFWIVKDIIGHLTSVEKIFGMEAPRWCRDWLERWSYDDSTK